MPCALRIFRGPGNYEIGLISNLVKKKIDFLSKKILFSVGSVNRENHLLSKDPLPGQQEKRF
jgi:hypothetical protein